MKIRDLCFCCFFALFDDVGYLIGAKQMDRSVKLRKNMDDFRMMGKAVKPEPGLE